MNPILYQDRCDQQVCTEIQDLRIALSGQEKFAQTDLKEDWREEWFQLERELNQADKIVQTDEVPVQIKTIIQEKIIIRAPDIKKSEKTT